MSVEQLRQSQMMSHLLDALDEGHDIGHYGRLVFTMVARFFMDADEVAEWLIKDPEFDEDEAKALYHQVVDKDYSPPSRQKVLQFQQNQDFPICPDADDPQGCNVYRDLDFGDDVYEHINEFHAQKFDAERGQDSRGR